MSTKLDGPIRIDDFLAIKTPVRKRWGNWFFRSGNLTLQYIDDGRIKYELDLERFNSSAELLDMIFQVHNKGWGASEDMLSALQAILNPQGNYCSGGRDKRGKGTIIAKKYKERLKKKVE